MMLHSVNHAFFKHMLRMLPAVFLLGSATPYAQGVFTGVSGGDSLRLNLTEAIYQALERNPSVSIVRIMPQIAETTAREQRSAFEPRVTVSASRSESDRQQFLGRELEPLGLREERQSYSAGISETLPTGTTVSITSSMGGYTRGYPATNNYTDQASGTLGLTVTQSLLQGFGLGPNLASLRKANLDVDITRAELKAVAEETASNVERAYWALYLAQEEISIQEKSLELAERLLKESEERVEVGKLAELDLATVRAEAANRRETLIDARGGYEQARLNFLFMLNPAGPSSWSSVPVLTDAPFIPVDSLASVDDHEALGMKYRADLIQSRLSLQKGEIDVVRTRNGLLPRLDFFITLGRTTYAFEMRDAKPDIGSQFGEVNGGFTFGMPVSRGDARARYTRAKRSREHMELAVQKMERTVQRDVRSAYVEVLRARQQINATRITRELQEQKLDAELEKFRVGKSTNYLVLQAQRDYTASRRDEARSMVTYLNSLTNLYLMEGTLLERRGIQSDVIQ